MKYCPKCGVEIDDEAVVCVKCGYQFNAENLSTENESMEEPENVTTQNENNIIDTPKKIDKLMFWKWSKKKLIIVSGILAIVIISSIVSVNIYNKFFFDRLAHEIMKEYPHANVSWRTDGTAMDMDTKEFPDNETGELTNSFLKLQGIDTEQETLHGIRMANEKLGFPSSLYEKMIRTTASMGVQTDENDRFYVSWTYHPDEGLEVKWEKKR